MAARDKEKYYWLKLDRYFFKRHDICIMEDMPEGKLLVLFYLKLMVEAIDHEGALITAEDIAAALWEDEPDVSKAKHRLRNLISDLRSSLKAVGQEDILIRKSGLLAVRRDAVECDFFRMLDGDMAAVNSYRGEYMKQFSWARETEARLQFL